MKYCIQCGRLLAEEEAVCKSCGQIQPMGAPVPAGPAGMQDAAPPAPAPLPTQSLAPPVHPLYLPYYPAYAPYAVRRRAPSNRSRALPFFIWGLILIVLINIGGLAAGAAAAVFSVCSSAAADPAEAERRRKQAKIACIAGTCFDGAALLAAIVYAVALLLRSRGTPVL